jgi:hypothetical protein
MTIARTPLVDDDGSGTTGTILNNAWQTRLYDQIDAALVPTPPTWIAVAFAAANFTASSGLWTVEAADQINYSYAILNANTLMMTFDIRNTSVSVLTQFLYLTLPASKIIRSTSMTALAINNNGVGVTGAAYAQPGANKLYIMQATLAAWAVATNATAAMGTVVLDVASAAQMAAGDFPPPPPPIDPADPRWMPAGV